MPVLVYQNVDESTNAETRHSEIGKYDLSNDMNTICMPMVLSDGNRWNEGEKHSKGTNK